MEIIKKWTSKVPSNHFCKTKLIIIFRVCTTEQFRKDLIGWSGDGKVDNIVHKV